MTYRLDPKALAGDERNEAKAERAAAVQRAKDARQALEARREELLRDPEYQRLVAKFNDARKAEQQATSRAFSRRIVVGKDVGFANHVLAEGDNW
jgi:catalase (peroxidase I)